MIFKFIVKLFYDVNMKVYVIYVLEGFDNNYSNMLYSTL